MNPAATAIPDVIEVVDMHTGGEPVRIPVAGMPPVPGASILAKRRYARERLDHLRRLLMFEPRGHRDMYGAWLVEPTLPGADLAVLFMHNEGYSTMCGHAVIALGRFAVDRGLVPAREPVTRVGIECPCGLVEAWVAVEGGRAGAVRFDSVPAFALALDQAVEVPGAGRIVCDVAYGGAFYAFAPAAAFGLSVTESPAALLTDAADALSQAVKAQVAIRHPDDPDLGFLYGTILTDGGDGASVPSANVCVFAEREVDRSPTGSGVTARMALLAARGRTAPGRTHRFQSLTGAVFTGELQRTARAGPHDAWVVRVGGQAHYMGEARFRLEPDDAIGRGFLLR
jgi:trans-L-3-hydroxyproline dehydratase